MDHEIVVAERIAQRSRLAYEVFLVLADWYPDLPSELITNQQEELAALRPLRDVAADTLPEGDRADRPCVREREGVLTQAARGPADAADAVGGLLAATLAGLDAALAVPGWSGASSTYRAMYARALRNSRLAVAWSRTAAARSGRSCPRGRRHDPTHGACDVRPVDATLRVTPAGARRA